MVIFRTDHRLVIVYCFIGSRTLDPTKNNIDLSRLNFAQLTASNVGQEIESLRRNWSQVASGAVGGAMVRVQYRSWYSQTLEVGSTLDFRLKFNGKCCVH